MATSILKITSKGQVTFKKEILQHFGLRPGDNLILEYDKTGEGRIRAASKPGIERLFGSLKPPKGTKLTLDQIAEIAARGWAGER